MKLDYKQVSWLIGLVIVVIALIIFPDVFFDIRMGVIHAFEGEEISPEESSAFFNIVLVGIIGKTVAYFILYLMKNDEPEFDEEQSPFTSPITSYLMKNKLYTNKKTLKYALIFFLVGIALWITLIFFIKL